MYVLKFSPSPWLTVWPIFLDYSHIRSFVRSIERRPLDALAMVAVAYGLVTVIRYRGLNEEMSQDTEHFVRSRQDLEKQISVEERLKVEEAESVVQTELELRTAKSRMSETREQIDQANKRQEELELDPLPRNKR